MDVAGGAEGDRLYLTLVAEEKVPKLEEKARCWSISPLASRKRPGLPGGRAGFAGDDGAQEEGRLGAHAELGHCRPGDTSELGQGGLLKGDEGGQGGDDGQDGGSQGEGGARSAGLVRPAGLAAARAIAA